MRRWTVVARGRERRVIDLAAPGRLLWPLWPRLAPASSIDGGMSHPATARLFIALDLPGELRQELSAWARLAQRRACSARGADAQGRGSRAGQERSSRHGGGLHGVRALDPELLHLTVIFLGSRPVEEIEPLSALIESLAQPQIGETSIGAPLWLPARRPRALAVEVHDDSGALAGLHRAVSAELAAAGLDSAAPTRGAKRRAFRPHVTVARLRDGAAPRERTLSPTPARSFVAQRLVLYRSWLSPEGASYEALAAADTNNCSVRTRG